MGGIRPYVLTWAGLLALLALTVSASFLLSGPPSLLAGMAIALAKAALILWFFMHLREETGLVRLFAIAAAAWLVILALLTSADYATRHLSG
ncbi:cytochrome C oxidase subunit IV family protein [Chelativorans sp. AA-79]|uniref:cytochrome C oxidase subunit IV family protein n=1 Tax=Chelativorans sp. AA-79 TaxID=3028735 RepID=UPI0023FA06A9|nr:cytochrome C oxidase subunit IV family protein [Chelativorans sp. AA-79]WEX10573.1 cytochrome C oxidase subunit IV family protein [Chelativorans sp. AA-79]